ncbi:type VI secretion system protein TssA [Nitratireductor sp. GCM10026969]|uniref:type VI secretion system protein TssA n=1 Tax=Nitratireductor sp. GCM10026969 TaxID=3252645 RepID=UPI003609B8DE
MPSPQTIDVDALLAPISDEAPGGIDPRSDASANSLYYRVKDARNAARSAERAAVETGGGQPEEWDTVVEAAVEVLSGHAKDLEISAWLIEGLVRRNGFDGLRDGLKVMTGIITAFWDECFPELDEDGVEGKLSAVAGLTGSGAPGTLIQPIRLIPLTHGAQWDFSLWSFEQANDLEKVTDAARKQERIDNGSVTMDQFLQSVAETPATEFLALTQAVDDCLAALAELSDALDTVAGAQAPSVSGLRDILQEINSSVRHFAADKLVSVAGVEADTSEESAPEGAEGAGAGSEIAGGTTAVRRVNGYASREEALAEITRIAGYFRKTEPHSPISYTLEDAVRRARMSLPELLGELTEDPSHTQRILMAAGIRTLEPESSG